MRARQIATRVVPGNAVWQQAVGLPAGEPAGLINDLVLGLVDWSQFSGPTSLQFVERPNSHPKWPVNLGGNYGITRDEGDACASAAIRHRTAA